MNLLFVGHVNIFQQVSLWLEGLPFVRYVRRFFVRVMYLLRSFAMAVRDDGLGGSFLRLYNYIIHGKGVTNSEKYKKEQEKIDRAVHNLDTVIPYLASTSQSKMFVCTEKIDIIIPLYNGFDYLAPLFKSILQSTTEPYRLIIVEDCSSDERIRPFITQFIEGNKEIDILYIENEQNLGFVKSVNKAVKKAQNHFVLLNSDTEVPQGWLSRLMAPIISQKKIASTTPFTNAGEIFSFPTMCEDYKLIGDLDVNGVDQSFARISENQGYWDVPTGMGFCMGINKDVVDEIGMFDEEAFGKGYGEENDWCQRALAAGYRNVLVHNLFVYHKHGGSFPSQEKKMLIEQHLGVINKRYPSYHGDVARFIKKDPYGKLRELLHAFVLLRTTRHNHLIFDHALGGGANIFTKRLTQQYVNAGDGVVIIVYDTRKRKYTIDVAVGNYTLSYTLSHHGDIASVLSQVSIAQIIINEMVSYPDIFKVQDSITKLKEDTHAHVVFYLHDYFAVSPNFTLVDETGKFSGVHHLPEDLDASLRSLKKTKTGYQLYCNEKNIILWRTKWEAFLHTTCDDIITFSQASRDILMEAYPSIQRKIKVVPHDVSYTQKIAQKAQDLRSQKEKKEGEIKVIGVLGSINYVKGAKIIQEMAEIIRTENVPLRFVIIGEVAGVKKDDIIGVYGKFHVDNIAQIAHDEEIDMFFIPSIWPETFSYTTSEIIAMEYPLAVFDLGAPAERVRTYKKGVVINQIDASVAIHTFKSMNRHNDVGCG